MNSAALDKITSTALNILRMSDNKKKGVYLSYECIKGLVLACILAYQFINNGLVREVPSTMKAIEELSAETRSLRDETKSLREDIKDINSVLRRAKLTSNTTGDQISTATYN